MSEQVMTMEALEKRCGEPVKSQRSFNNLVSKVLEKCRAGEVTTTRTLELVGQLVDSIKKAKSH